MQQFNASVIISEQLNRLMVNAAQELAQRAVSACAEHYKFDAEEAIGLLGLNNVKLESKSVIQIEVEDRKQHDQKQCDSNDDSDTTDDHSDEMVMVLIQVLNTYVYNQDEE
jgi:hypothetical protein